MNPVFPHITLDFNNTCNATDTLSSKSGIEDVICDLQSGFDRITAVHWIKYNSEDTLINNDTFSDVNFLDGDSFQIQSVSSSFSNDLLPEDQLYAVPYYAQLSMIGQDVTGNVTLVGFVE